MEKGFNEERGQLLARVEEETQVHGGVSGGVFNLSTTIVGAGIMALPATMKIVGVPLGVISLIALGILSYVSVEFLLRFSDMPHITSYGDAMNDAFGKPGKVCLEIFVILKTLGILVVYLIIIADVLSGATSNGVHHEGILEEWFGVCWWTTRAFSLLITITVLLPLLSLRFIDSLKYSSLISVALALVFLIIVTVITVIKLSLGKIQKPRLLPELEDSSAFWKLFQVIPVMITSYICHFTDTFHCIKRELSNPVEMRKVTKLSYFLCTSLYVLTGLFGYLLFGDETMDDVLANFDTNLAIDYSGIWNTGCRISYALHLLLVFRVVHFALRENIDSLVFPFARKPLERDRKRFYLITAVLVTLIYVGAVFIPSLWDAFQVMGATVAAFIGLIFPASLVLKDRHGISRGCDKSVAGLMVVVALVCSAIALLSNIL